MMHLSPIKNIRTQLEFDTTIVKLNSIKMKTYLARQGKRRVDIAKEVAIEGVEMNKSMDMKNVMVFNAV